MNAKGITIEDFKNVTYMSIKINLDILEVAKVKKDTIKGAVPIPVEEIVWEPLTITSYPFSVFTRLRGFNSPKLMDTKIGKLIIWDNYALRVK